MKGTLGWREERKQREEQFVKGHCGWAVENIPCTAGKEETHGKLEWSFLVNCPDVDSYC